MMFILRFSLLRRGILLTLMTLCAFGSAGAQDYPHIHQSPLDETAHDCVEPSDPVNPEIVAQMRKTDRLKDRDRHLSSAAPTVSSVVGKTMVAVFYIHIHEGGAQQPLNWTPTLYQEVQENVRKNADWWEETAGHYGKGAELSIIEYGYESPVTYLDYDPTASSTSGGFLVDRSFYDTIMNRLGYTLGSSTDKMTAFCQDLAAMNNADQAFVAWIITGKTTIRSNASFFGPSTNIWHNAARTGWTTAHEFGHIFGAFDEYYEEGTEYARSRQSRNGAPNGNLYYRNYPQIPCMMSYSHDEGICSYTAVHVGLTDQVRLTRVESTRPNGTWQVRYRESDDRFGTIADRYQGEALFPWGAGMRVELTAFDSIGTTDFGILSGPEWEGWENSRIEMEIDTGESGPIILDYGSSGGTASYSMTYLAPDKGGMGANVFDLIPLGPEEAAVASRDGICIYRKPERLVLDIPFEGSRDGSPRRGYSVALASDSAILFGTQNSEIVVVPKEGEPWNLVGPSAGQKYYGVAATPDGDIWGGSDAGLHRFRGGKDDDVTTYVPGRDPLIGQTVWSLAVDGEGKLWIASRGRRDQGGGGGGLQVFDPVTDAWTDYTEEVGGETVTSISIWGDTVAVGTLNGFALYDGEEWSRHLPGNDFNQTVMMVSRDAGGRLLLATFGGLYRQDGKGGWENYSKENGILPDNLCLSAALGPDGTTWVGTGEGTIVLLRFNETPASVAGGRGLFASHFLTAAPNPARTTITVRIELKERENGTIRLYDQLGRLRSELHRGPLSPGLHTFALPVTDLESGPYHLHLTTDHGSAATEIIVEK